MDMWHTSVEVLSALPRSAYIGAEIIFIIVGIALAAQLTWRRTKGRRGLIDQSSSEVLSVAVCSASQFTSEVLKKLLDGQITEDGKTITITTAATHRTYDVIFVNIDHPCDSLRHWSQRDNRARLIGLRTAIWRKKTKLETSAFEQILNLRDRDAIISAVGVVTPRRPTDYTPKWALALLCLMAIAFFVLLAVVFIRGL